VSRSRGPLVFRLLALLLAAPSAEARDVACARYAERSVEAGRAPVVLPELSGLTASRRHPGIYWAHNDSGNPLALYAIRENGTVVATFPLRGATARDPEDIALGPCAPHDPRTCIYLADTGDNLRARRSVQLVRAVEPDVLRTGALEAESIPFTYPDGAHDAEAVLVDPRTAAVYVLSKSIVTLGDAYRLDVTGTRPLRAVHVATVYATRGFDSLVTAGSVHPSGTRILLRTYRGLWELRRPDARSLEDVLRAEPVPVPTARHLQGEAVTYVADGGGYVLGGEGVGSALVRVGCATP
jgi:hypothetical protein